MHNSSRCLRALLDPSFGTTRAPFTRLTTLPGTINAADFDTGTDGIAYHDVDSKRTSNDSQWNQGWEYRNDGVDVQKSSDPEGFQYNVGWIADGEWTSYSVDVKEARTYAVDLRVASAAGPGKLRLLLDNQQIGTDLDVGYTGGWQNWRTLTLANVNLSAGPHVLKLEFPKGDSI